MTVYAYEGPKTEIASGIKHPANITVERLDWNPAEAIVYEASRHIDTLLPINQSRRSFYNLKPSMRVGERTPVAFVSLKPADYDAKHLEIRSLWASKQDSPYLHLSDEEQAAHRHEDLIDALDATLTDVWLEFDDLKSVRMRVPQSKEVSDVIFGPRFSGWRRVFTAADGSYIRQDRAQRRHSRGKQVYVEYQPLIPQHEVLATGEASVRQAVEVQPVELADAA